MRRPNRSTPTATSTPATPGFFDAGGQLKIIDRAKDVGKLATGAMFAPNYIENKLKFFPHIKEAVAFGAERDHVCAFINIDMGSVGNWAERRGIRLFGLHRPRGEAGGVRADPRLRRAGQRASSRASPVSPTRRCTAS